MLPNYTNSNERTDRLNSQQEPYAGPSALFSAFSASIWSESKKRAQSAYNIYGKVDALRPYFDVEPNEVAQRILASIDPRPLASIHMVSSELYGAFMACLTLIAVLLFEMKISHHQAHEGTLMGSAIITCIGYWLLASSILTGVAHFGNSPLTFFQLLSTVGYALCSSCIVIFVCALLHSYTTETLFVLMWFLICGCATIKLTMIVWSFIPNRNERIICSILSVVLNMGFVLYLHFAYHSIVQDISSAIGEHNLGVKEAGLQLETVKGP